MMLKELFNLGEVEKTVILYMGVANDNVGWISLIDRETLIPVNERITKVKTELVYFLRDKVLDLGFECLNDFTIFKEQGKVIDAIIIEKLNEFEDDIETAVIGRDEKDTDNIYSNLQIRGEKMTLDMINILKLKHGS